MFILYWFYFYHFPHLPHVLWKLFDYDVVFSLVLKRAKSSIERDLCSLWGFLRVGTEHSSMNVIESRFSVWCLCTKSFPFVPTLFFPIRLLNNKIWNERCCWHVYFSHSMNAVRYFAFLWKVTWTQLYKMFIPAPSQYCYTSLAPSQSRVVPSWSYKLYVPRFAQPLLSTVKLHWLACKVLHFLPIPLHYMYVTLPRPLSVVSYRIGSLSESCLFLPFPYMYPVSTACIKLLFVRQDNSRVLQNVSF